MEKTAITEELLTFGKDIFVCLHDNFGFDFEKNIGIYRHDGKFTVNSIFKFVESKGFTRMSDCVLLITSKYRFSYMEHNKPNLKAVRLKFSDGSFDRCYYSRFGSYWRNADFHDDRKCDDCIAYIIVQRFADKPKRKSERDYLSRFKLVRVDRYDNGQLEGIILEDSFGKKFREYNYNEADDVRDIIDGSGFLLRYHRDALAKRLKEYKQNREKLAYSKTDNRDKVVAVNALVAARKAEIVDALMKAKTFKEINEVESALSRFTWVLRDVNDFTRKTAEKSYNSIAESDAVYKRITYGLVK